MKTFDVMSAQQRAAEARRRLGNKICRHYRGGRYRVLNVVVCEETGDCLVIYQSLAFSYVWSRKLDVFGLTASKSQDLRWALAEPSAKAKALHNAVIIAAETLQGYNALPHVRSNLIAALNSANTALDDFIADLEGKVLDLSYRVETAEPQVCELLHALGRAYAQTGEPVKHAQAESVQPKSFKKPHEAVRNTIEINPNTAQTIDGGAAPCGTGRYS